MASSSAWFGAGGGLKTKRGSRPATCSAGQPHNNKIAVPGWLKVHRASRTDKQTRLGDNPNHRMPLAERLVSSSAKRSRRRVASTDPSSIALTYHARA